MRILCAADLHLGRFSASIPEGRESAEFSTRDAWQRLCRQAIAEKVDAVMLAGDVIDARNAFFEAYGALEKGLKELSDAGIDVCVVAGNQDHDALQRFFSTFNDPRVHFLGKGGAWERKTLTRHGKAVLHVDGWSFPGPQYRTNPLDTYTLQSDNAAPILGLLHGEIDGGSHSVFAPVPLTDLEHRAPRLWVVGHRHQPDSAAGPLGVMGGNVVSPGSPQALNASETGPHGVVFVDWNSPAEPRVRFAPLSTIRYDIVEANLDGADESSAVDEAIHRAIDDYVRARETEIQRLHPSSPLAVLSILVRLIGTTQLHKQLSLDDAAPRAEDLLHTGLGGRIETSVRAVEVDTRPAVDLASLAELSDPRGILAKLLLTLEQGEDHPLIAKTAQQMETAFRTAPIDGDLEGPSDGAEPAQVPPDAEAARRVILRQGRRLLTTLLAQKDN